MTKNTARVPYLALAKVVPGYGLCTFCRFAEWIVEYCGAEAALDCKHPLWRVNERSYDVWEGGDCWGFRPLFTLAGAADAMGILLQALQVDWESVEKVQSRRSMAT